MDNRITDAALSRSTNGIYRLELASGSEYFGFLLPDEQVCNEARELLSRLIIGIEKEQSGEGHRHHRQAVRRNGNKPIPLRNDTASYDYCEFLMDKSTDKTVMTLKERIHFNMTRSTPFISYQRRARLQTEPTEVITAFSNTPNPALFVLPSDFSDYANLGRNGLS